MPEILTVLLPAMNKFLIRSCPCFNFLSSQWICLLTLLNYNWQFIAENGLSFFSVGIESFFYKSVTSKSQEYTEWKIMGITWTLHFCIIFAHCSGIIEIHWIKQCKICWSWITITSLTTFITLSNDCPFC